MTFDDELPADDLTNWSFLAMAAAALLAIARRRIARRRQPDPIDKLAATLPNPVRYSRRTGLWSTVTASGQTLLNTRRDRLILAAAQPTERNNPAQ